ncbi:hypothetical protein CRE_27887 [Caenorhabditis remanei]|uniref:RING-type domain-containing protein n=1 Tax=Caenorhabditis remanei TaxID=31234 RepID=E3NG94_CAERE|nr:hypothetical protein CRE_27887 [Caenorhabditis remanei]
MRNNGSLILWKFLEKSIPFNSVCEIIVSGFKLQPFNRNNANKILDIIDVMRRRNENFMHIKKICGVGRHIAKWDSMVKLRSPSFFPEHSVIYYKKFDSSISKLFRDEVTDSLQMLDQYAEDVPINTMLKETTTQEYYQAQKMEKVGAISPNIVKNASNRITTTRTIVVMCVEKSIAIAAKFRGKKITNAANVAGREASRSCMLCLRMYNSDTVLPKTLRCGHSCCEECVGRITVKHREDSYAVCAECRRWNFVSAVVGFPTSISMIPGRIPPHLHIQLLFLLFFFSQIKSFLNRIELKKITVFKTYEFRSSLLLSDRFQAVDNFFHIYLSFLDTCLFPPDSQSPHCERTYEKTTVHLRTQLTFISY